MAFEPVEIPLFPVSIPGRLARLALPALVLLSGCLSSPPRPDGLPHLEDVNVLMIVVDTLGAGHVGCLNPRLDTTPNIDRLASSGVLFNRAYSPAPWTQPSVSALMTGRMPSHTGVLHLYDQLSDENETLAELLQDRGFATRGIVSHFLIAAKLGFAQGFGSYDESAVVPHHRGISSPQVTAKALEQLDALQDKRFFMFLHFFDPHAHYLHHPEFDRTSWYKGPARDWDLKITELRKHLDDLGPDDVRFLRDLYREEIAFTDAYIGMILDRLEALGLREKTLVILTADHGEEFMEHGWIGHTRNLHDTLVHVPLIISLPGAITPASVDSPVGLVDIVPTLMDLSGKAVTDPGWDGMSLAPILAGGAPDFRNRPLFHEVAFPYRKDDAGTPVDANGTFLAAVSQGRWKLIHDLTRDQWSLYDRQNDPWEQRDVAAEQGPMVRRLRNILSDWEQDKVPTWGLDGGKQNPLDKELEKRLKSLGYIR